MVRGHTRIHRLPQRLDYTLIPAPLDLTLPLVDEKSPLPAIIVTPSSPLSATDFSIAFLAPHPKPTIRGRIMTILSKPLPSSPIALPTTPKPPIPRFSATFKARTIVTTFLLLVVMACHVITHRMAIQRPRMDFESPELGFGNHYAAERESVEVYDSQTTGPRALGGWLSFWKDDREQMHDFVVDEVPGEFREFTEMINAPKE